MKEFISDFQLIRSFGWDGAADVARLGRPGHDRGRRDGVSGPFGRLIAFTKTI